MNRRRLVPGVKTTWVWPPEFERAADAQGWNIFDADGQFLIERDDEAGVFDDDLAAIEYVKRQAARGRPEAIRALEMDQQPVDSTPSVSVKDNLLRTIDGGIEHLKLAREAFKRAGATKTTARIRLALTSAGGALRHAEHVEYRNARKAKRRVAS